MTRATATTQRVRFIAGTASMRQAQRRPTLYSALASIRCCSCIWICCCTDRLHAVGRCGMPDAKHVGATSPCRKVDVHLLHAAWCEAFTAIDQ